MDDKRRRLERKLRADPEFAEYSERHSFSEQSRYPLSHGDPVSMAQVISVIGNPYADSILEEVNPYNFLQWTLEERLQFALSSPLFREILRWRSDWIRAAFHPENSPEPLVEFAERASLQEIVLHRQISDWIRTGTYQDSVEYNLDLFVLVSLGQYLRESDEWFDAFLYEPQRVFNALSQLDAFPGLRLYNRLVLALRPKYRQSGIEQRFNILLDRHWDVRYLYHLHGRNSPPDDTTTKSERILNAISARSAQELSWIIMIYRYMSRYFSERYPAEGLVLLNFDEPDIYRISQDNNILFGEHFGNFAIRHPYGIFSYDGTILRSRHVTGSGYEFQITEDLFSGHTTVVGVHLRGSENFAPEALAAINNLDIDFDLEHDWVSDDEDFDDEFYERQEELERD